MFHKLTNACVALVQRYLPDPFLFAVGLTIVVYISGILATGQGVVAMTNHWVAGFWKLLAFSMQMTIILVTGHAMANAPVFRKALSKMAKIAKTPNQAIFAVTVVSLIASVINWGFGLVIGALYARQLAREVKGVDFRLLIAAAYSGFLVWHGGLSGSIPLKIANVEGLEAMTNGAVVEAISTSATLFSPMNIVLIFIFLFTLPFVNIAMHPLGEDEIVTIDPSIAKEEEEPPKIANPTPAERLENSSFLSIVIGIMGMFYVVYYFSTKGFVLNLDIVNFTFLFSAILLHGTPKRFLQAVNNAVKGSAAIIIQFPFYAGIMGMMVGTTAGGASLAGLVSNGFISLSTAATYPLFTFLSAGVVNFFIPSGGGQWAVQAPIMMPAGAELGIPAWKTAMAIAWGDAWTNMIQPFWALPALGIAGLSANDIMGFCLVVLFYSGLIISIALLLF